MYIKLQYHNHQNIDSSGNHFVIKVLEVESYDVKNFQITIPRKMRLQELSHSNKSHDNNSKKKNNNIIYIIPYTFLFNIYTKKSHNSRRFIFSLM